jgi:hypothetical protein
MPLHSAKHGIVAVNPTTGAETGRFDENGLTADTVVHSGPNNYTADVDSGGNLVYTPDNGGQSVYFDGTDASNSTANGAVVLRNGGLGVNGGVFADHAITHAYETVPDVGSGVGSITPTNGDSDHFRVADTSAGNQTYLLPAFNMYGRKWRFIKGHANNNMIITAPGAWFYGAVRANGTDVNALPSTTATFTAGAVGDYIELEQVTASLIWVRGFAQGATFAWS